MTFKNCGNSTKTKKKHIDKTVVNLKANAKKKKIRERNSTEFTKNLLEFSA